MRRERREGMKGRSRSAGWPVWAGGLISIGVAAATVRTLTIRGSHSATALLPREPNKPAASGDSVRPARAGKVGVKKVLPTVAVILTALAAIGAGTFATFNAQARNSANSLSTGTLVLSDQKNTATACLSTAGGST